MSVVVINATNYTVYGDAAGMDAYLQARFDSVGVAWTAATATKRLQALVQAARLLDRQLWQGTAVGTPVVDLVLQWPRNGVIDRDGNAVSSASIPDGILKGAYELSGLILANANLPANALSGSNVRRVKADTVEVEFFTSTLGITGALPPSVEDLVGQYLASTSASGVTSSTAYGTDAVTQFDDDSRLDVV